MKRSAACGNTGGLFVCVNLRMQMGQSTHEAQTALERSQEFHHFLSARILLQPDSDTNCPSLLAAGRTQRVM